MSRKTLIISIILSIIIIGLIMMVVTLSKPNKTEQLKDENKDKQVGPALSEKKDRQKPKNESQANKDDENKEKPKDKKDDKKQKDKNTKSEKARTKELTDNATYIFEKTIKGTENKDDESKIESIATDKMVKQIEGADTSNEDQDVDIRNTSIKFKNTHGFKDKTIKGTFQYDLIVKAKNKKDKDNPATTKLNQKSAIKFIKEGDQYKLDEISK